MEIMTHELDRGRRFQDILEDINTCDSSCEQLGMIPTHLPNNRADLTEWLLENLPGIQYGLDREVHYIFSNGLTTGDEKSDERLREWLYETRNKNGAVNYSVLQAAIKNAIAYGESAIRLYDGALYEYKQGYFGLILNEENGIEEIVAAYIDKYRRKVSADIKDEDWGRWEDWYGAVDYFDRKELILLDFSEFRLLRNDTAKLHGTPTLLVDKQRVELLMSVYQRLNYDIDFDGPGRYIFWEEAGYTKDPDNEVQTTSELLKNAPSERAKRRTKAQEEIKEFAKNMKSAGSDSIGVVSRAISRDYLHIPRVTKATEFFGWLEGEAEIVSQLIGMDSILLGVGDVHGNVSMEKLIDDGMLNTIIPLREKYAIQFSGLIAGHLNVPKVFFNKYDLKQVKDENEERKKISTILLQLSSAYDRFQSEEIANAMNNYARMLNESAIDNKGNLRLLT